MKKSNFFTGNYLFHVHTDVAGGGMTVEEVFEWTRKNQIEHLIFLEHIRKEPTYDVYAFVDKIRKLSKQYDFQTSVGFEAKILDNGLDITSEQIAMADVVGMAEHGIAEDGAFNRILTALYSIVNINPQVIWVHPGRWYGKYTYAELGNLMTIAKTFGYWIEWSTPRIAVQDLAANFGSMVYGADAHCIYDLERWEACRNHFTGGTN